MQLKNIRRRDYKVKKCNPWFLTLSGPDLHLLFHVDGHSDLGLSLSEFIYNTRIITMTGPQSEPCHLGRPNVACTSWKSYTMHYTLCLIGPFC